MEPAAPNIVTWSGFAAAKKLWRHVPRQEAAFSLGRFQTGSQKPLWAAQTIHLPVISGIAAMILPDNTFEHSFFRVPQLTLCVQALRGKLRLDLSG